MNGFASEVQNWEQRSKEVRSTLAGGIANGVLQDLNRPGAWLLDCVYSQLLVLRSDGAKRQKMIKTMQFSVVYNKALSDVLHNIDPHFALRSSKRCPNVMGNQMEQLAWLALECDLPHIILSLAWHAGNLDDCECPVRKSPVQETPRVVSSTGRTWEQYTHRIEDFWRNWWCCVDDDDFFIEAQVRDWQQFQDPVSGRAYWCHIVTQEFFWTVA